MDIKTQSIPNKLIIKYKKYENEENFKWMTKNINLYDEDDEKIWLEHPKYGSDIDVVAILIEENETIIYNGSYEINTNYMLDVSEPVFILGFPLGYVVKSEEEPHSIWTYGTVASDPSLELVINNKKLPAFLIDSRTRKGQSGSPVIYYSNSGFDAHYINPKFGEGYANWGCPFMKEIGIYSRRINKDSDLGYVWKWEVLREIVDSNQQ